MPKPRGRRLPRKLTDEAKAELESGQVEYVKALKKLAKGGHRRTELVYKPAGSIWREVDDIETVTRADGTTEAVLRRDTTGRPVRKRVPAYPDLDPSELVLVEKKMTTAEPDRAANQYLIDRIKGRPAQGIKVTDQDDSTVKAYIGFDPEDV